MSARFSAVVSFLFVFIGVFFLAGWFLLPHLPPTPDHPVGVFEAAYWTTNWIGLVLGLPLGALSAWQTLRSAKRKQAVSAGT